MLRYIGVDLLPRNKATELRRKYRQQGIYYIICDQ